MEASGGRRRSAGRARCCGPDAAVAKPRDGLFELRFSLGPTALRITYRFTSTGTIVLLTTFRKQRSNERLEIVRAREVAVDCALRYP